MIKILSGTTTPISDIGKYAGTCWGADTSDEVKNYNRGYQCMNAMHGRTFEYPDVILEISGYSARVIREFYTHVIGVTKLQESTRYIDCSKFEYYIPKRIANNPKMLELYNKTMEAIKTGYAEMMEEDKKLKEDIANVLPLGMVSKIVVKINLRAMLHMFEERTCSRAYVEFRDMMKELKSELISYSDQWKTVIDEFAKIKCEKLGYCPEHKGCGKYPSK